MKRILASETVGQIGQEVQVEGWVNSRRDHGGLIFIDLRDHTGIVQLTIASGHQQFDLAESLRDEFVIRAIGKVVNRAEKLVNPNIDSGSIEIVVDQLQVLNSSEPLPFPINDSQSVSEEVRLKYRYLDLRRDKMQKMLVRRSEYFSQIRDFMKSKDFVEITTPILANSSPEGARDFLVPSRLHPGKFYALPQAPQQFKQLLMTAGIPRYYQLATCFRDEDPRADRLYGEFYQLDLEMSFVEDGEEVRQLIEPLITDLVVNFARKQLKTEQIPRISYREALDRYGSDKPDLRFGMELVDLTEALSGTDFGVFANAISSGGVVKAIVAPAGFSRKEIDQLTEFARLNGAGGLPYLKVEYGTASSAIAKFLSDQELESIVQITEAEEGGTIFFGVGDRVKVNHLLGALRSKLGTDLGLKDPNVLALAWVIDFPFYELDSITGKLDFGHNPFTMPLRGPKDFEREDKLAILADQFDMVMNGYEVCSGGVRNYHPESMYRAFAVLGHSREYVDSKFGAMIGAFKYGAPPHAGCAFGVDRMFMELMGEGNIREVVAFPKNGSGVDLMMNSPSQVDDKQLEELSVGIKNKSTI
ncbi:aspartate--tRNA ligase [Candidatus Saccharibacteria bacterium]|nr:aspartate--tRNA ligase [Candidatus Saccharibacteria bacterium]MCB9835063.1 aspartate--tRNA ligase [Candidatus Nomurabacteria bacterium]